MVGGNGGFQADLGKQQVVFFTKEEWIGTGLGSSIQPAGCRLHEQFWFGWFIYTISLSFRVVQTNNYTLPETIMEAKLSFVWYSWKCEV